jgi:hypothetical protein
MQCGPGPPLGIYGTELGLKYDRPVWQIMHLCADAMPEVFRYEDVRTWFAENYPDVNEATIRAHLIGLTEGGRAKHVQFAARSPIFRRVARGEYEPIPRVERAEDPNGQAASASKIKMSNNGKRPDGSAVSSGVPTRPTTISAVLESGDNDAASAVPDVILLGSVGDRVNVPAPAKEIFREVSFQLSRLDAELSGSEWFILSAEHGLMAPNEWISPDSRTLADMDPEYRVVWASWVVARLQSLVGSVAGMHIRVNAPNAFIGPLFADLQDAGAIVTSGSLSVTFPADTEEKVADTVDAVAVAPVDVEEPVDQDDAPQHDPSDDEPEVAELDAEPDDEDVDDPDDDQAVEDTAVTPLVQGSSVTAHLLNPGHIVHASDTKLLPNLPGLYAWFVDAEGARVLNRCLKLPVREGLVFVGQVGGSTWHSTADPVLNVRDHVERIQLHGRTRASTFRMTLATVLGEHLGMTSLEDPKLTAWMTKHLSISAWGSSHVGRLAEVEQLVIAEVNPPLNVDHLPATEYRSRLNQMRRFLG